MKPEHYTFLFILPQVLLEIPLHVMFLLNILAWSLCYSYEYDTVEDKAKLMTPLPRVKKTA